MQFNPLKRKRPFSAQSGDARDAIPRAKRWRKRAVAAVLAADACSVEVREDVGANQSDRQA